MMTDNEEIREAFRAATEYARGVELPSHRAYHFLLGWFGLSGDPLCHPEIPDNTHHDGGGMF